MKEGPRILIVEDHVGIVDALRLLLEEDGYQVEIWMHGAMVRPLCKPLPDLILLDLLLGGMDGKMLCQQFKGVPTTRHIPVILMSANKHIASIATEVGADAWLLKPFEMETVFALLDQYVGRGMGQVGSLAPPDSGEQGETA
ncbi:MAG TPA: response regulator [Ktedonosporobacter sp.]|nr:response regulator [Ktedonosporobacter sp.]